MNLLIRFYDFQQGKIIEEGTHESLLVNHGFYARLFNSQFDE